MKKLTLYIVTVFVSLFSSNVFAFIPPAKFIVEKMVGKAGSGAYAVEQDVVFTGSVDTLTLREIWQVDGEGQLRLTVRAPKEMQDRIGLQNVYVGNQKYFLNGRSRQTSRLSEDFFEKYLYVRGRDSLMSQLLQMKILTSAPPPAKQVKVRKTAKGKSREKEPVEFVYPPEPNVRLDRHGGVIVYAFGAPTPVDAEPNPGFWIEQDLFFLRKFRLPSKVEVVADRFGAFAKGLWLPQQRTVRWSQKSVQINLVKVTSLPKTAKSNLFTANSLEPAHAYRMNGIFDPDLARTIEEFYQRFR